MTHDRTMYIGGSDIGAIVGLNPWRSPLDVYLDKVGEAAPVEPNEQMRLGSLLEPMILAEYAVRTGRRVARRAAPYVDRTHPFIAGHVDGIVRGHRGARRVVEAKATRADWDAVPDHYQAQVQWYMRLARAPVADVVALVAGSSVRVHEVPADAEAQRALVEAAVEFWRRHVEMRVPPPPRSEDDVRRLWRATKGKQVVATEDAERAARELAQVREQMSALEDRERQLRDAIATTMLDATELIAPDGTVLVTFAGHERTATDWRAVVSHLSAMLPQSEIDRIVGECTSTKEVRTMRLKRTGE